MSDWKKFRREMEQYLTEMGAEPVSPDELSFARRASAQRSHPSTKRDAHRIQYHRTWRGERQTDNWVRAVYVQDGWKTPVARNEDVLTRSPEPPRRQEPEGKRNFGRAH